MIELQQPGHSSDAGETMEFVWRMASEVAANRLDRREAKMSKIHNECWRKSCPFLLPIPSGGAREIDNECLHCAAMAHGRVVLLCWFLIGAIAILTVALMAVLLS